MPTFTPVQQRMLNVLADGLQHTPKELHTCLEDELGPLTNIQIHISNIRSKLRPIGQDIAMEKSMLGTFYRHVRLLAPTDGRR